MKIPETSRKKHDKKSSPKGRVIDSPFALMVERTVPVTGMFLKTVSGRATQESLKEQQEGVNRIRRLRTKSEEII